MRSYDLSPIFRSSVGFDRLNQIFDNAFNADENTPSYPPYNIERRGEDGYQITMALAGFVESDLDVTVTENRLVVTGKRADEKTREGVAYLHRGIATRAFERRFQLAEHVKVSDATLKDGLLTIELALEIPESKKPQKISIRHQSSASPKVLEGEAA
jgi:molecular chaperone IbpA